MRKDKQPDLIQPLRKGWQLKNFLIDLKNRMKIQAIKRNCTISSLVEDVIKEWLEENED